MKPLKDRRITIPRIPPVTLPIVAVFSGYNFIFCVHRNVLFDGSISKKYWIVSELTTGCSLGYSYFKTIREAIAAGKRELRKYGKERVKQVVNRAFRKFKEKRTV